MKKFKLLNNFLYLMLIFTSFCAKSIDYKLIRTQAEKQEIIPVFFVSSEFLSKEIPFKFRENLYHLFLQQFQKNLPQFKIDFSAKNYTVLLSQKDYYFTEIPHEFRYQNSFYNNKTLIHKGEGFQIHQTVPENLNKPLLFLLKLDSTGTFKVYGHDEHDISDFSKFTLRFSFQIIDASHQKELLDFSLGEIAFSTEELLAYTNFSFTLAHILSFPDIFENFKNQIQRHTNQLSQNILSASSLK